MAPDRDERAFHSWQLEAARIARDGEWAAARGAQRHFGGAPVEPGVARKTTRRPESRPRALAGNAPGLQTKTGSRNR